MCAWFKKKKKKYCSSVCDSAREREVNGTECGSSRKRKRMDSAVASKKRM
jgi:hypothetical protein